MSSNFCLNSITLVHSIINDLSIDGAVFLCLNHIFHDNIERFRSLLLWHWGIPNGLVLTIFHNKPGEFSSVDEVMAAIESFELFLSVTFGSAWRDCTLALRQRCRNNMEILCLKPGFLQSKFERACAGMYSKLRTQYNDPTLRLDGAHWSAVFVEELASLEITRVQEMSWLASQHLIHERSLLLNPVKGAKSSPPLPSRIESSSSKPQQICLKFLRFALKITTDDCSRTGCSRLHEEVFNIRSPDIMDTIKGLNGVQDILEAIQSSNSFRN
jgi:hypothetical protein